MSSTADYYCPRPQGQFGLALGNDSAALYQSIVDGFAACNKAKSLSFHEKNEWHLRPT